MLNESTRMWSQVLIINKHWKMVLNYRYLTLSFQHGRYRKKIRKIPWRLSYLLSSITPAWYHPYVHFEVSINTHCSQTMALFCWPAAQEFWERWQCSCRQNTSVATTVLKERFLFQRLSWGVTCHHSYYPTNFHEDWWISHGYFQGLRKYRSC